MVSLTIVFWMLVIIFAVIGAMRGWAKELLVTFALILSIFVLTVLDKFAPGLVEVIGKRWRRLSFLAPICDHHGISDLWLPIRQYSQNQRLSPSHSRKHARHAAGTVYRRSQRFSGSRNLMVLPGSDKISASIYFGAGSRDGSW